MALSKEKKAEIVKEFGRSENDSGSPEAQIALLTYNINGLQQHFKANHLDNHSRVGLIRMVNRRRSLLSYLKRKNLPNYKKLIDRLNLRR